MTNPTLPNADELEVVATAWKFHDTPCVGLTFTPDPWHMEKGHLTEIEPLVTLSSAQAQIDRVTRERDEMKAEAADYARGITASRHRAEAAEAEVKRVSAERDAFVDAINATDLTGDQKRFIQSFLNTRSALSRGTSNG